MVVVGLFTKVLPQSIDIKPFVPLPLWLIPIIVFCQLLFIFGSGTIELCRPIKKKRLLIPVVVASMMLSILFLGLGMSLIEFFRLKSVDSFNQLLIVLTGVSWFFWGWFFFVNYRTKERYQVLAQLTKAVLGGNLIQLLIVIPVFLVVRQRPGCFAGLLTSMGLSAGICVMIWAFGPGIVLLFLREKRQKELAFQARSQS